MRHRGLIIGLVAVLTLGAAVASAQTVWIWKPFRLLTSWAIDATVAAGDRFTLTLIEDKMSSDVCLAVVLDTQTTRFSVTSVPRSACDARR